MKLKEIWDIPEPMIPRRLWKFYFRKDRRVTIEVAADNLELAWQRLEEVILDSILFHEELLDR